MSADPDNEYSPTGSPRKSSLTVEDSRVARDGSNVVMRYKKTQQRAREIGHELGVSHLLMGSVRRAANRVRVVAQLIDAESDQQAWAETYDCDITDIFAVQSQVAEHIATACKRRSRLASAFG